MPITRPLYRSGPNAPPTCFRNMARLKIATKCEYVQRGLCHLCHGLHAMNAHIRIFVSMRKGNI